MQKEKNVRLLVEKQRQTLAKEREREEREKHEERPTGKSF